MTRTVIFASGVMLGIAVALCAGFARPMKGSSEYYRQIRERNERFENMAQGADEERRHQELVDAILAMQAQERIKYDATILASTQLRLEALETRLDSRWKFVNTWMSAQHTLNFGDGGYSARIKTAEERLVKLARLAIEIDAQNRLEALEKFAGISPAPNPLLPADPE